MRATEWPRRRLRVLVVADDIGTVLGLARSYAAGGHAAVAAPTSGWRPLALEAVADDALVRAEMRNHPTEAEAE